MKKSTSILLVFFLMISLFSIPVSASTTGLQSGIYTYSVSGGCVTITACDPTASGVVAIPAVIDGYSVTAISQSAFEKCRNITEIIVPPSVTSISSSAFRDTGIEKITISDNTISYISAYLFYDCWQLADMKIPEGVDIIDNNAFRQCINLETVQFPSTLEIIGNRAFQDCWSLTNVVLPNRITTIDGMAFYNCETLQTLYVPKSLSTIGNSAFAECSALKYVFFEGTESDWNNLSIEAGNQALDNAIMVYNYGIKTYVFEENGGSNVSDIQNYGVMESPVTMRTGYEFDGWYDNSAFTGEPIEFPYYAGSTTLYAKWIPKKTYRFHTNGGSIVNNIVAVSVEQAPSSNKKGYTLVGWYDNAELQGIPVSFPYDGECTDFYAKWEELTEIEIGDYVQLGTYLGEPILWRCVISDDNGKMLISDKQLTMKCYSGGNFSGDTASYGFNVWETSDIRSWLNSTANAGEVLWLDGTPPDENATPSGWNAYSDEAGFLSQDNFSEAELTAIKAVNHKVYTEGLGDINMLSMIGDTTIETVEADFSNVAYQLVEDKMFILDLLELKQIYHNRAILGDTYYYTYPTEKAMEQSDKYYDIYWDIWLRNPYSSLAGNQQSVVTLFCTGENSFFLGGRGAAGSDMTGIRPAFYLADDAEIFSGNGTADSPFMLVNQEPQTASVDVYVNEHKVVFEALEDLAGEFIVALYDKYGTMKHVTTFFATDANKTVHFGNLSDGDYTKIMWWNGFVDLKSICNAQTVTLQ